MSFGSTLARRFWRIIWRRSDICAILFQSNFLEPNVSFPSGFEHTSRQRCFLLLKNFPKRYILWVCMSSFGGCVCEMWTTWMCLPVAVPAHPRILAGRRFLRFSPTFSLTFRGRRGVAGFPEIRFYLHKEIRDREIRFYLHNGGDLDENGCFL